MSDLAIQVNHVWKKFRKGELHDSLRELIPAVTRRLFGRAPKSDDLNDREFWALKDVCFEVKRGESLGIIGPNGAGKSTMLKLLSRIIRPNKGEYKVNGRVSALIEVGAGFHHDLTGRENIYLSGTILGMSKQEIKAKEEQIIDFAGVEAFIETPVKRYSSGMTARLGFAVAAHMEPDVLLVDEVLSVGDAKFRRKCLNHMAELIKSDVTVVFISHLLDQVRTLCPRSIVLKAGEVIYDGQTPGAIKEYLDALDGDAPTEQAGSYDAELQNIRLCDPQGNEVLEWETLQPATVAFDLIMHKPIPNAAVVINFSSLSGVHLGTAHTLFQDGEVPTEPGRYPMRFTLKPMMLADGDYQLDIRIDDSETGHCVWASPQPRAISVRGHGHYGQLIRCDGHWEVDLPNNSSNPTRKRTNDLHSVVDESKVAP